MSHRLSQRQLEKAPEGVIGNYREQHPEFDHTPEHVDRRLPSPRPQLHHADNHSLPPPIPYGGTTTPPTPSRTAPRFVTNVNSDRMENGAAHGNAKIPSHVGGRHLSPPPHPDTENDGVEAAGDGDDVEDEDEDDFYADDVNQDHVHPVAAGTEPEIVSTGGVEPSAADIHPHDEQEGYEHGIGNKALQKEPMRDVSGGNHRVEANSPSGGGVMTHGSTEEMHAV